MNSPLMSSVGVPSMVRKVRRAKQPMVPGPAKRVGKMRRRRSKVAAACRVNLFMSWTTP